MLRKQTVLIVGCVMLLWIFADAEAQQTVEDVVYLKDGSIIRGIIVKQVPSQSLQIRTQRAGEMTLKMSDVLEITKALPMTPLGASEAKHPFTAFGLSALSFGYGYGQVYNGQYGKAGVHLVLAAACLGIILTSFEENSVDSPGGNGVDSPDESGGATTTTYLGLLIGVGNWGYSMFDAYSSAKKINNQNRRPQSLSLAPYLSDEQGGAIVSFRF